MKIYFIMNKQELEKLHRSCKKNLVNSCIGCSTIFECKSISDKVFIDKLPCDWNSVDIRKLQKTITNDFKKYKKV